jgi:hypothetical protein
MERILKTIEFEVRAARNLSGTGTVDGIKAQRRHLNTALETIEQALAGHLAIKPLPARSQAHDA